MARPEKIESGSRWCKKCDTVKLLEAFHKDINEVEGRKYTCKPCECKRSRGYYHKNPEKCKVNAGKAHRKLRARVLIALGNKCNVCGIDDFRVLQIDHINGGGKKELASINNHYVYLHKVLASVESGKVEYQLLCANHNWIKKYENKEL